jgi:hypothetical protein
VKRVLARLHLLQAEAVAVAAVAEVVELQRPVQRQHPRAELLRKVAEAAAVVQAVAVRQFAKAKLA